MGIRFENNEILKYTMPIKILSTQIYMDKFIYIFYIYIFGFGLIRILCICACMSMVFSIIFGGVCCTFAFDFKLLTFE